MVKPIILKAFDNCTIYPKKTTVFIIISRVYFSSFTIHCGKIIAWSDLSCFQLDREYQSSVTIFLSNLLVFKVVMILEKYFVITARNEVAAR